MTSSASAIAAAFVLTSFGAARIWADPFTFDKVVDNSAVVPGGLYGSFTRINIAAIDGESRAFVGTFTTGAGTQSGLYRVDQGVITPMADFSLNAPGGGGAFTRILGSSDYNDGVMVFSALTADGKQGLYRYNHGGLQLLVKQGDALPGGTHTLTGFLPRGVAGDANEFAFNGRRSDDQDGLYVSASGFPMYIADNDTRAPGPELGNFIDFPELHLKDYRTVFVGRSLETDRDDAIVEPAGVFIAMPGNPVMPVAWRNQPIPGGAEHHRFLEFEKPRIDRFDRVAFTGGWEQEDPNLPADRYMGVYAVNPDGTFKVYGDSSMVWPGATADVFEFWGYTFDGAKPLVGMEDMNGESYIYIVNDFGPVSLIISSLMTLDGKDVTQVRMAGDTITDGLLTFRATFSDGSTGLYTVQTPEPAGAAAIGLIGLVALARRRRGIGRLVLSL